jgi:hypothetical protein
VLRRAQETQVDMREFMDYVHSAFYDATSWNRDNTYAALNATSDGTALRKYLYCQ